MRWGKQGLKLTFFYWCQLATKPKFLVARWKILVANFFGELRMKRMHYRLIIFTPISEKPQQMNQMQAIYAVSCQVFQVKFIPSLVSTFSRTNISN